MNNDSVICSRAFLRNAKVPWGAFVFLAAVFFTAEHDLFYHIREHFGMSAELLQKATYEGSLERRGLFSVLGLFGAVGLMRRGGNRLTINGLLGWLILFYLVWGSLSVAWADDVALTFRRLTLLYVLCVGALAVSKHFSPRDIILWIFFATAVYLLIGIACEIALGAFRPLAPGYRFAGTLHFNYQGINCSLLLLTGLAAGRGGKRGRWFFRVSALVGLVFLVLTGSRTSFTAAICTLLAYWALVSSRSRKLALLLGVGTGFCLLALLIGDAVFPALQQGVLLGRTDSDTSSFTGRVPLWKACLDYAAGRPLQGYGYNSFWSPSKIGTISATLGWAPFHSHSAYLELFLGVGMVGMTSFVLILVLGIKKSINHYKASLDPGYSCFIAIFVFCLLDGVLESMVAMATMLSFVTMVVLAHLGFTVFHARSGQTLERKG